MVDDGPITFRPIEKMSYQNSGYQIQEYGQPKVAVFQSRGSSEGVSASSVCVLLGAGCLFLLNLFFIASYIGSQSQYGNLRNNQGNITIPDGNPVWVQAWFIGGYFLEFVLVALGVLTALLGFYSHSNNGKFKSLVGSLGFAFMLGNIGVALFMMVPYVYVCYYAVQLYQLGFLNRETIVGPILMFVGILIIIIGACNVAFIVICQAPYALCGFGHGISFCARKDESYERV